MCITPAAAKPRAAVPALAAPAGAPPAAAAPAGIEAAFNERLAKVKIQALEFLCALTLHGCAPATRDPEAERLVPARLREARLAATAILRAPFARAHALSRTPRTAPAALRASCTEPARP